MLGNKLFILKMTNRIDFSFQKFMEEEEEEGALSPLASKKKNWTNTDKQLLLHFQRTEVAGQRTKLPRGVRGGKQRTAAQ